MRVEFLTPNGRTARVPESLADRYAAAGWVRVEAKEAAPTEVKPRPVKRSPRKRTT
jgi:hypothetical protein